MSVRQIDFQLLVLRKRLHACALDIEQMFGDILLGTFGSDDSISDEQVRSAVRELRRGGTKPAVEFAALMEERQPGARDLMGYGVTAATRLFHHAESANGAPMGRVTTVASLWQRVLNDMIRTVFIHPQMYTTMNTYPLSRSIELIETMLDTLLYAQVPLTFTAVPVADVIPLTSANLAASTERDGRRNTRTAPSIVSMASTAVTVPAPVAAAAAAEPPRSKQQLVSPMTPPDSRISDDAVKSIISQRLQAEQEGEAIGSVLTSYTRPGVMKVRIPEAAITTRGGGRRKG